MPHFHVNYNDSITSIGVKKGNTKLLNKVNQILKTISDNNREKLMSFAIKQQPQVSTTKKTNWFVSIMHRYGKMILNGVIMTVFLSLIGTIIGFFIGLLVGIITVSYTHLRAHETTE